MTCVRCGDKGTIFHPWGGSEICPECRVIVSKSEVIRMQGVEAAVLSGEPPLPDFLDWLGDRLSHVYHESPNMDFVQACHRHAQELREALATKFPTNAGLPPMDVREKLDAIVDAHDRAEAVHSDIEYFKQNLSRVLGIPKRLLEGQMTPEEKARQIVAVIGATGIPDDPKLWKNNIATAIREAVQEERETCAKIADAHKDCFEATANGSSACKSHEAAAHNIAGVIRSRGGKP